MKVLLQNLETRFYLQKEGTWSKGAEQARDFANSLDALTYANSHRLKACQIVLKFSGTAANDIAIRISKLDAPNVGPDGDARSSG